MDCEECNGEGTCDCPKCGTGTIDCEECEGSGGMECESCGGDCIEECATCDGTGEVDDDYEDILILSSE